MTTLLVSEIFPPAIGGSGRWFWQIYQSLPRDEYLLAVGEHPRQQEFDQTHALRVVRVPLAFPQHGMLSAKSLISYLRALKAVRHIVRLHGVDQIHAARCVPEGWIARMLKRWYRLPYLCYVGGEDVKLTARGEAGGKMSSRQLRWMTGQVLRGAGLAIAVSQSSADILRNEWHLSGERVGVLRPGVDIQRFAPAARDEAARERLGWGNRPVILTLSRLQKRKGHDSMILALKQIRPAIPDVLYAIVGDGTERRVLENLVSGEGLGRHVQFLGQLEEEELVRCYQQCDLFVLPNRQVGTDIEGFGIVLLEAQACGKPVVAGASGGTAETMQIPDTGQVVPCDGPEELARLVVDLLGDRQRLDRMGEAARRWTVERFDSTALSARAEALFRAKMRPGPSRVSARLPP
jgi:phosphatidylinositol alpha-1,6-mannosyltransferase